MPRKQPATKSDLRKVDAHRVSRADYEEAPELDEAFFDAAVLKNGGKPVRGRPKSDQPKAAVSLRLDKDVLEHFKSSGPGWQSRMNSTLRKAARLPSPAKKAAKRRTTRA